MVFNSLAFAVFLPIVLVGYYLLPFKGQNRFLLIASLFYVGQKWADYAGKNRVAFGLAMVAVGLTLVGVAILLGG